MIPRRTRNLATTAFVHKIGSGVGDIVGEAVGVFVGSRVGGVGARVGAAVGDIVGGKVGAGVGRTVGAGEGVIVGAIVGDTIGVGGSTVGIGVLGVTVGAGVGCTVTSEPPHPPARHVDLSSQCAGLVPQYPHWERHCDANAHGSPVQSPAGGAGDGSVFGVGLGVG